MWTILERHGPGPTRRGAAVAALLAATAFLSACSGGSNGASPAGSTPATGPSGTTASGSPGEKPVPVESNPPGDIPDTTQYVLFQSSKGSFAVKVPEGWSRVTQSATVAFSDKLNTVAVTWTPASSPPTVDSVRSNQVPALRSTERAFLLGKIVSCAPSCTISYPTGPIAVRLPAGNAVVLTYQENSAPNPVTGRQYRLEVVRFDFYRSGEEADLVLSGPVLADNVDPWRLVAQSFQWK